MPFPRGVLRVGPLVDWGFAVNGVGSVLGATLAVFCAFTFGFRLALLGGALLYLAAFGLLAAERWWRVRTVPDRSWPPRPRHRLRPAREPERPPPDRAAQGLMQRSWADPAPGQPARHGRDALGP